MRGASALQDLLNQVQSQKLRVFVIWEPVIASDLGPPTTSVLARVSDARAVQFWDESRSLSKSMVAAREDTWLVPEGESAPSPGMIIWDFVAVFPPGGYWRSHLIPTSHCDPVVECIEKVSTDVRAHAR